MSLDSLSRSVQVACIASVPSCISSSVGMNWATLRLQVKQCFPLHIKPQLAQGLLLLEGIVFLSI